MTPEARIRPGWLLTALLGGMFLGNVDIAIVNIATPSIHENMQASGGELELIVSGYTLTYAMLLVTSARLGDMRGHRRMFLLGLSVFTAASLACGLAPTGAVLVCARIVQGGGAALMASQVLTGIQLHIGKDRRARALGLYTAVLSGSAVLGQVLGGVLVSANLFGSSWRPIFLINVPIGLLLLVVGWLYLPADQPKRQQRLDLAGVGVLSAAMLLLVVPLVLGRDEGWPLWTWLCLAASLPAFGLFVLVERRVVDRGGYPLVTMSLLTRPPVAWALISQAATRATYFALLFVLALYLQQGLGKSPVYSGLALVSWVAAFGVAGPLLGRASARTKRLAAPGGTLILTAAFAGIAGSMLLGVDSGATLVILLGVGGFGYGAAFSGTLTHLTSTVTDRYAADVSGLFNTTLQVGGTLGVAAFGTLYLNLVTQPGAAAATRGFTAITIALAVTALVATVLSQLAVRVSAKPAQLVAA